MEEGVPPVQVSAPGGESSEVTLEQAGPGLWRSTVDVKVPGLYKLQTQSPTGALHAVANAGIEDAARDERGDGDRRQAASPSSRPPAAARSGRAAAACCRRVDPSGVDVPRISMLANATRAGRLGLAGPQGPRGLRHPRRQADPMFTGLLALAALLALLALTWWREGR